MNRMLPTALVGVGGLVLAYWYASRGPRSFPVEYLRRRDAALPVRLPGEPSGDFSWPQTVFTPSARRLSCRSSSRRPEACLTT